MNKPEYKQLVDAISPSIEFLDAFNRVFRHGRTASRRPNNCVQLESFLQRYVRRAHEAFSGIEVVVLSSHAEIESSRAESDDHGRILLSVQRFILVLSADRVPAFAMTVSEYPQNCGSTMNAGRVYISYIDKCNLVDHKPYNPFFDIVSGYLTFAAMMGYKFAHIWSCPPSETTGEVYSTTAGGVTHLEAYIFQNDNAVQMTQEELDKWYVKLLNHGGWYFDILGDSNIPASRMLVPAFVERDKKRLITSQSETTDGHVFAVHLRTLERYPEAWELIESGRTVSSILSAFKEHKFSEAEASKAFISQKIDEIRAQFPFRATYPSSEFYFNLSHDEVTLFRKTEAAKLRADMNNLMKPFPCDFWI